MNRSNEGHQSTAGRWDRFWFTPCAGQSISQIRAMLCLISIVYFVSHWFDVKQWYGSSAPLSTDNVATFLRLAGLESEGRWSISPLFLTDNLMIYHGYLIFGVAISVTVLLGRAGRTAGFLLWALVVGWANRSLILSSLGETLLSLSLFSLAFASPTSITGLLGKPKQVTSAFAEHWSNRFSQRLLAVQITVVGLATFATMLAGRVWWNGLGAYALVAPVQDRSIDWSNSFLAEPFAHDLLTFAIVSALPIGLALAWRRDQSAAGIVILVAWCLVVALLSSHWLYAATFASMALAISSEPHGERESARISPND